MSQEGRDTLKARLVTEHPDLAASIRGRRLDVGRCLSENLVEQEPLRTRI
jgi:hypothetical protein